MAWWWHLRNIMGDACSSCLTVIFMAGMKMSKETLCLSCSLSDYRDNALEGISSSGILTGKGKSWNHWSQPGGKLVSKKERFYTILTTCETTLWERLEPRWWWVVLRRATPWPGLLTHASSHVFKSKPHVRTRRWVWWLGWLHWANIFLLSIITFPL